MNICKLNRRLIFVLLLGFLSLDSGLFLREPLKNSIESVDHYLKKILLSSFFSLQPSPI